MAMSIADEMADYYALHRWPKYYNKSKGVITMRNTEVVTGKVRFSFLNVFAPKASQSGGEPKYSVTLLIPKSDTATMKKIWAAMAAARENYCNRNGASSMPPKPSHTIHDGDGLRPGGEEFGPECKGCYVITVSCKADQRPGVYDAFRNDITDPSEIKSGDYGRAHINFFCYNTAGKKGVSAGLLAVQKLCDGEPFGVVASASAFDDGFSDGGDDDFLR